MVALAQWCEVIDGVNAATILGEDVPHEQVRGLTQHPLAGTCFVSNRTDINGYSGNGHDYSVLCSPSQMYNYMTETVNQSTTFFIIFTKTSLGVICDVKFKKLLISCKLLIDGNASQAHEGADV